MVACVTAGLIAPGVSFMLGNPDDCEYVAAPQALRPKVAAIKIPAVKSADALEVLLMRRVSHALGCGWLCSIANVYFTGIENQIHFLLLAERFRTQLEQSQNRPRPNVCSLL